MFYFTPYKAISFQLVMVDSNTTSYIVRGNSLTDTVPVQ